MEPQLQADVAPTAETNQATSAKVVQIPVGRTQAKLLEIDESMSEFEWARITCKTWDMEQD